MEKVSFDNEHDLVGIKTAILNYFTGVKEGDLSKVKKAFLDSNIHMKGIMTIDGKPELKVWADDELLKVLVANASEALEGEIISINIYSKNAAFALFNFNNIYIDAFQLFKIDNEWRIINKAFVEN